MHRHRGRYTEFRFTCRGALQLINLSQTTLWKGTCPLRGTGTRSSRSEDPGLASLRSDQTKSSSCKFEVFCHVTDPNMTSLSHILHSTVQYSTVCSFTSNCSYYFFRKLCVTVSAFSLLDSQFIIKSLFIYIVSLHLSLLGPQWPLVFSHQNDNKPHVRDNHLYDN